MALEDSFGRSSPHSVSTGSLLSSLLSSTKPVDSLQNKKGSASVDAGIIEKLAAVFKKEIDQTAGYIADIISKRFEKNKRSKDDRGDSKNLSGMNKNLGAFTKKALSENTIAVKNPKLFKEAKKQSKLLADIKVSSKHTKDGISEALKPEKVANAVESKKGINDIDFRGKDSKIRRAIDGLASVTTALLGGADVLQLTFQNVVSAPIQFRTEMSKIAFQMRGLNQDTKALQDEFRDVGTFAKVIAQTGKSAVIFQGQYTKNLRKGLGIEKDFAKAQRQSLNVTKSALTLSTLIDSNAEDTGDTLYEWHQHLQLSDRQIARVSTGIRDVARMTGVSGDNLLRAAKNSETFLKQMRQAGTLTADAVRNVIALRAGFEKIGIADELQPLMTAMTSFRGFLQSSTGIQALAIQALGPERVRQGGQLTRDNFGLVADRIEQVFAEMGTTSEAFVKGQTPEDIRQILEMQLPAMFEGLEAGTLARSVEQFRKANEGMSVRLANLQKEREKFEKDALSGDTLALERVKQIDKDIGATKFSGGLNALQAATEQLDKGAKTWDEALKGAAKDEGTKDTFDDLNAAIQSSLPQIHEIGKKFSFDTSSLEGQTRALAIQMAEDAKMRGGDTAILDAAIQNFAVGGAEKVALATQALKEQQDELLVQAKANADPITKLQLELQKINAWLQDKFTGHILPLINNWTVQFVAVASAVAALAIPIANLITSMVMLRQIMAIRGAMAGGTGAAAGGLGLRGLLRAGVAIAGIAGAIGGVVGAINSFGKAAEYFGVAEGKLTVTQKAASAIAGYTTGFLDTITFGLFDFSSRTKQWALDTAEGLQVIGEGFKWIWEKAKSIGKAVYDGLAWASEKLISGVESIGTWIASGIKNVFWDWPIFVLGLMKDVFIDFPVWLGSNLFTGLKAVLWDFPKWLGGEMYEILAPIGTWLWEKITTGLTTIGEWFATGIRTAFVDIPVWLWNKFTTGLSNLGSWLWNNVTTGLVEIGTWTWNTITSALSTLGTWTLGLFHTAFVDIPIWLWDKFTGALGTIGNWTVGVFQSAFIDFPKWLWEKITAGWVVLEDKFSNFGPWLWDKVTAPFAQFGKWFVSLLPGWVKKLFGAETGPDVEIAHKKAESIVNKPEPSAIATSAVEVPQFQMGANEIKQSGLAMLHEGEMVVPSMFALADKPFEPASSIMPLHAMGQLLGFADTDDRTRIARPPSDQPVSVQSKPIVDVYDKIREQQAGTESIVSKSSTKEMSSIERATNKQVDLLSLLHQDMEKVITLLSPTSLPVGNQGSAPNNSATGRKADIPVPNYGQWAHPGYGGNASRRVIFDGR
jgi:hypothetical protein